MRKSIKKAIISLLLFMAFGIAAITCAVAGSFFTWIWLVDKMGLTAGTWTMAGILFVGLFIAYKLDNLSDLKLTKLPKKNPPKGTARVYISGKITGLSHDEAHKNFDEAEKHASDLVKTINPNLKIEIINPMKLSHRNNPDWVDYMAIDLEALMRCNVIYLLDNWADSKGARIEFAIADQMGHSRLYQNNKLGSYLDESI